MPKPSSRCPLGWSSRPRRIMLRRFLRFPSMLLPLALERLPKVALKPQVLRWAEVVDARPGGPKPLLALSADQGHRTKDGEPAVLDHQVPNRPSVSGH